MKSFIAKVEIVLNIEAKTEKQAIEAARDWDWGNCEKWDDGRCVLWDNNISIISIKENE